MPDWADPKWRREHLAAWAAKEAKAREHPSWAAARKQWAAEVEERGQQLPSDLANLLRTVAMAESSPSEATIGEIQRRLAAHQEKSHA